jgi:hypothetical protein
MSSDHEPIIFNNLVMQKFVARILEEGMAFL